MLYPDGGKTTYCYTDIGGSTCSKTAPPFQTVTTTAKTSSVNKTVTTSYDVLGRVTQSLLNSDPDGPTHMGLTVYDGLGRPYKVYNPTRCSTPTTNCGELTWGFTTYNYDALSRSTSTVEQDGSTLSYQYTANTTNCTTTTDEASISRQICSDALGRLTHVTEDPTGFGYVTNYTYDALNNLTSVVQNGSRQRTLSYDSLSRLTQAVNPESGTVTYSYDANGDLTSKTSPAPNQQGTSTVTISYCYDALNRMTAKAYTYSPNTPPTCSGTPPTFPSPAAVFVYDQPPSNGLNTVTNPMGRLVAATTTGSFPTGTYYSYDPVGRVTVVGQCVYINNCSTPTQSLWGSTSTYDLIGNLTSYTDGSGDVLTQTIDNAGRPTTLSSSWKDSTHPPILLEADPNQGFWPSGALAKAGLGNGLSEAIGYNNRLQACRIGLATTPYLYTSCSQSLSSTNVQDYSTYYMAGVDNGNLNGWAGNGQQNFSRSYGYDTLNRLFSYNDSVTTQACKQMQWTIDAWGNMTQQQTIAGSCNQLDQPVNAKNQFANGSYDAAGNLLGDGVNNYSYDAENRIQYVNAGGTATYVYDANGKRVAKGTPSGNTYYIYGSDDQVVAERNTQNGWVQTYIYFGGNLIGLYNGSDTRFILADHLGSSRIVTLSSGTVYDSLDYLPFGTQIAGNSGTTHKFTSQERDSESNLDNFGARYFSSSLGRFMRPDPGNVGADPRDPQSWNAYAYTGNNPLSRTDSSGLDYSVCLNDGQGGQTCTYVPDDKSFQNALVNPGAGIYTSGDNNSGTIYASDANGNLVEAGTYQHFFGPGEVAGDSMEHDFGTDLGIAGLFAGFFEGSLIGRTTAATSGVWSLGNFARGNVIEQMLGGNLPRTFPVIDAFENGVATSIKSIDLTAVTYQAPDALARKLTGYVDKLAEFQGAAYGEETVNAASITSKVLKIAVPEGGANAAQQAVINRVTAQAAQQGVKVIVVQVR